MIEIENTSIDHTRILQENKYANSRHISGDLGPPRESLYSRNLEIYLGQLLEFSTQSWTNLKSISRNIQNVTNIYYENKLSTIALFNRILNLLRASLRLIESKIKFYKSVST